MGDVGDLEDAITAVGWYDNKPVYGMSTAFGPESTPVERKDSKRQKHPVDCPKLLAEYNKHMGGTDKFDFFCLADYVRDDQEVVYEGILRLSGHGADEFSHYVPVR